MTDLGREPPPYLVFLLILFLVIIIVTALLPPLLAYEKFSTRSNSTEYNHTNEKYNINQEAMSKNSGELHKSSLIVSTEYGDIIGVDYGGVRGFHGVPFARPPVGQLRWMPPQDLLPWKPNVRKAALPGPACPQNCSFDVYCPEKMNEDCLYLEIYSPNFVSQESPLPVMLFIHGGSFQRQFASSSVFNGTKFVEQTNCVLVFMQYRIGVLGFLYTGDNTDDIHGNFGIQDQKAAIKWVSRNIRAFGGDPDKITLAGQSAGAQSVLIHEDSSTSHLFHQIILQSPALTLPFKIKSNFQTQGRAFASLFNCTFINDVDVNCLRSQKVEKLIANQDSLASSMDYIERAEPWGPMIDNTLISSSFTDYLGNSERHFIVKKPVIWSINTEEAFPFVYDFLKTPVPSFYYSIIKGVVFRKNRPSDLSTLYPATHSDSRIDISELLTDFLFRCPRLDLVEDILTSGSDNIWLLKFNKTFNLPESNSFFYCNGHVCHGIDIPYIFQTFRFAELTASNNDIEVSHTLIKYISSFLKTGDPNTQKRRAINNNDLKNGDIFWPKTQCEGDLFTQLLVTREGNIKTFEGNRDSQCKMWKTRGYGL